MAMMNKLPLSVRYPFLMIWCVFGGYAGVVNSLSVGCDPRHCGVAAQLISRLSAGASAPLFLVAAWMLWKHSVRIKNYGTMAFAVAMLLSTTQVAIGFAAIRPPEIAATIGFGFGLVMVFGYFMWLWVGVSRERLL